MPKLQLRGAHLRHFDCRAVETGAITRSHWTTDIVQEVLTDMGWTELSKDETSCKKNIELLGDSFRFETSDGEGSYELPCQKIYDFQIVRVKTPSGGTTTELRFSIKSGARESATLLFDHMTDLVDTCGLIALTYTGQASLFDAKGKVTDEADQGDDDDESEDGDGENGDDGDEERETPEEVPELVLEPAEAEPTKGAVAPPPKREKHKRTRAEMSFQAEAEMTEREKGLHIIEKSLEDTETVQ